tara:strand:+ start:605 stop:922 length:318 start_codon:yes stop_codon:yes gene_type:complete
LWFNQFISSAFTSIVVSLGLLRFSKLLALVSLKFAPQFMQLISSPINIVPHLLHDLTFDFKELKLINEIKNIKRGTKNIRSNILPIKLNKKFNPKIGIATSKIKE